MASNLLVNIAWTHVTTRVRQTLVGMAGPYGMIRQHDIRDWAQRKSLCHPYLAHRSSMLRDGWWQLHCELKLAHPPQLVIERRVAILRRGREQVAIASGVNEHARVALKDPDLEAAR